MKKYYNEQLKKFTWAYFENDWALLLRESGKGREKVTNIDHSQNNNETHISPEIKHPKKISGKKLI